MTRRAPAASARGRRPARSTGRPAGRSWSLPLISAAAVIGALALVALVVSQATPRSPAGAPSGSADAAARIVMPPTTISEAGASGSSLGSASAPVTIEVWSDFQCPYCGQLARSYLPQLARDFVSSGTVRLVAQDIAFLDRAGSTESHDAAAAAACAADQGRYWAFHDLLMWNQSGENEGAFASSRLDAMAAALHLDQARWSACRTSSATLSAVAQRTSRAGTLGISSTPTLVINGTAIAGLPPTYEALAAAIRRVAGSAAP